ncbi:hypothetical protein VB711_25475 [Cronbergia sp. UHCC 0137]|uniref:hypothetical protein n=1 Tax=Cronbergia sp. UHCC 0137 TaxID=3110239 RepID=UPI002B1F9F75|nr:hypothetical protein [Cronbergia sp. UHCC 0137]MEA5621159.1 hypothetical protein [Cronbergia sp. UHCC 0137]
MSTLPNLRQAVLEEINQIPDEQLSQVLQFLHVLISTSQRRKDEDFINDPLADFIGAVEHGSLAQNIDQKLYE